MAKKQSSAKMSKLAGQYVHLTSEQLNKKLWGVDPMRVIRDIRALAASVLSQDETKRQKKSIARG